MAQITSGTHQDSSARPAPRRFRAHDGLSLTYDDLGKIDGEPISKGSICTVPTEHG